MTQKIIQNVIKMPYLCIDCKYFKYSSLFPNTKLSKCTKIFEIDLVTGNKIYQYASLAREYNKCKEEYFEKKPSLIEKISNLFEENKNSKM